MANPILKLTASQYKRLLERIILREEGRAPAISREAMSRPNIIGNIRPSEGGIPVGGLPPAAPGFPLPEYLKGALTKDLPLPSSGSPADVLRVGEPGVVRARAGIDWRDPDLAIAQQIKAGEHIPPGGQLPLDLVTPNRVRKQFSLNEEASGLSWPWPKPPVPGKGVAHPPVADVEQLPSTIDEVMASEPPRELIMARLARQQEGVPFSEPAMIAQDYPYFEARRKYIKDPWSETNPGGYKPVGIPKGVKHLRTVPEGSPEDMGGGISYTAKKYRTVETPFERRARQEAGANATAKTPSLSEVLTTAGTLERMWTFMGGKRSISGKIWNRLREQGPGRNKVKDTRDYFIRCGLKWREDPAKFSRQYPRETKLLNQIWDELNPKVEAGVVPEKAKYTRIHGAEGKGTEGGLE